MRNRSLSWIIASVLLILFSYSVAAMGITPAVKTIDYEQGEVKEVGFYIYNNDQGSFDLRAEAKGDFLEMINLADEVIHVDKSSELTPFKLYLNFSDEISESLKPGSYSAFLIITKIQQDSVSGDTAVTATASVSSRLVLNVPYPHKYIDVNLVMKENEEGVRFVVPVFNLGSEDVTIKTSFQIFDEDKIDEIIPDKINLPKGGQGKIGAGWKHTPGRYGVKANIDYGAEPIIIKDSFEIGKPSIKLNQIYADNFRLGDVIKINLSLENIWNKEREVSCETILLSEEGVKLSEHKSSNEVIEKYSHKDIESFIDTKDITEGRYDFRVKIYNNGLVHEENIEILIKDRNISGDRIGMSSPPINSESRIIMFVIIIAIMVIVTINYFLIKGRRKKDQEEE